MVTWLSWDSNGIGLYLGNTALEEPPSPVKSCMVCVCMCVFCSPRNLRTPLQEPSRRGRKVEWVSGDIIFPALSTFSLHPLVLLTYSTTQDCDYFFLKRLTGSLVLKLGCQLESPGEPLKFSVPQPYLRSVKSKFLGLGPVDSLMLPRGFQCLCLIVPRLKQNPGSGEAPSQVCQDPSTKSWSAHLVTCPGVGLCGTLTWKEPFVYSCHWSVFSFAK